MKLFIKKADLFILKKKKKQGGYIWANLSLLVAAHSLLAVSSQIMQRDAQELPFIAENDEMKLHARQQQRDLGAQTLRSKRGGIY